MLCIKLALMHEGSVKLTWGWTEVNRQYERYAAL